jgi:FkbM family methyltransferase
MEWLELARALRAAPLRRALALGMLPFARLVGPRLARPRRVDWFPGWTFAASEDAGTPLYRLREDLWDLGRCLREPPGFVVPWCDGLRVRVVLGNDSSQCLYVGGTYEPNEFALLATVLRPGMSFVDVGANEGLYTLFAARRCAPGPVLALEPSTREFARLGANVGLNGLVNVRARKLAAHAGPGKAQLRIGEARHAGQNTLGRFAYVVDEAGVEEVELDALDHVLEREGIARVDALKIDAEGAELAILQGARRTLADSRPLLLIEVLEAALQAQGASRLELQRVLLEGGYRLFAFGPAGRPEPTEGLLAEGGNAIAVHPGRPELYQAVAACAAPPGAPDRAL